MVMPYSWVCYGCSWSGSWFEKIDANRYSCTKSLFPFCLLLLLNCNAAAFFFSSYLRLLIHWLRILSWCATPIQWHIWSILSYSLSFFSSFFFFLFLFLFLVNSIRSSIPPFFPSLGGELAAWCVGNHHTQSCPHCFHLLLQTGNTIAEAVLLCVLLLDRLYQDWYQLGVGY